MSDKLAQCRKEIDRIDGELMKLFEERMNVVLDVARYKKEAERLGIKIDERYMIAARNPEFRIYRMLTREHLIGRTIEEDERLRKEAISKEISVYDLKDFKELFRKIM